jgi:hypothetical protein
MEVDMVRCYEMAVEELIVKKMPEMILGDMPSTKSFPINNKLGRC